MAVNLKKGTPAKKKASADDTAETSVTGKFKVMLGNECKRYLTPGDKMYEWGKQYSVTAAERDVLFSYADDNGVRYFYDAEIILRQIEATRRKGRKQAIDEGIDPDELDTGAMSLNQEGKAVGVRGNVAV